MKIISTAAMRELDRKTIADFGVPGEMLTDSGAIDLTEGGNAIPYWMEDPFIRNEYEAKLKQNGVVNRMDPNWYLPPTAK